MKNRITEIFTNMTDLELIQAIREIKEDNSQDIIRSNGIVREKCKMVQDVIGGDVHQQITMVQSSILQESAYRFTPRE